MVVSRSAGLRVSTAASDSSRRLRSGVTANDVSSVSSEAGTEAPRLGTGAPGRDRARLVGAVDRRLEHAGPPRELLVGGGEDLGRVDLAPLAAQAVEHVVLLVLHGPLGPAGEVVGDGSERLVPAPAGELVGAGGGASGPGAVRRRGVGTASVLRRRRSGDADASGVPAAGTASCPVVRCRGAGRRGGSGGGLP